MPCTSLRVLFFLQTPARLKKIVMTSFAQKNGDSSRKDVGPPDLDRLALAECCKWVLRFSFQFETMNLIVLRSFISIQRRIPTPTSESSPRPEMFAILQSNKPRFTTFPKSLLLKLGIRWPSCLLPTPLVLRL